MHVWTDCCFCVFVCVYVYVVGWFARHVCRVEQSTFIEEKEPLRIAISMPIVEPVRSV